jgi:hypothetical protein
MSEEGQEIRLTGDFSATAGSWDAAAQAWAAPGVVDIGNWHFESKSGLEGFPAPLVPYLWSMNTIDLGGLELAKETFFPVGSTIQDPGIYQNDSETVPAMAVIDIITDKLIDPSEVIDFAYLYSNRGTMYGMIGNADDETTIVMGSYRFMTGNSNLTYPGLMRTEVSTSFSSGEPTAASKLYCYRIVQPWVSGSTTAIAIPASRFYLTGVRDKEEDLVYMMRLKRSYELDQTQS